MGNFTKRHRIDPSMRCEHLSRIRDVLCTGLENVLQGLRQHRTDNRCAHVQRMHQRLHSIGCVLAAKREDREFGLCCCYCQQDIIASPNRQKVSITVCQVLSVKLLQHKRHLDWHCRENQPIFNCQSSKLPSRVCRVLWRMLHRQTGSPVQYTVFHEFTMVRQSAKQSTAVYWCLG